jgi:hypothetical protein
MPPGVVCLRELSAIRLFFRNVYEHICRFHTLGVALEARPCGSGVSSSSTLLSSDAVVVAITSHFLVLAHDQHCIPCDAVPLVVASVIPLTVVAARAELLMMQCAGWLVDVCCWGASPGTRLRYRSQNAPALRVLV